MVHLVGVNTSARETSSTLGQGKSFGLGDRHTDSEGNTWCYVLSSTSVTAYDAVLIESGYTITQLTKDGGKIAGEPGFAQAAFAPTEYGWVMTSGRPTVRLAADCEPSLPLYATATGGVLDDATVSTLIRGVVATVSVTGATTAGACVAMYPSIEWGATLSDI